ncbi:MAG: proton-conducting transporter membrane subunit [Candidatus Edwardsbacteria bacterium]
MWLFILVPLAVAGILPLMAKISKRVLPDILGNLTMLFLLVYALISVGPILQSGHIVFRSEEVGLPVHFTLILDGLSLLLLITISLISLAATIFSIDYMEHYGAKGSYYSLFLLMVAGMNGLVLTADLFNLYVFLEVAAVSSYALVAFGLQHDELEASFKYLMLSAVASAFLLLSLSVIFSLTGQLGLAEISKSLPMLGLKKILSACIALFLMAFGLKAAIVPFHAWLPDAHPSAPAPISAMLSGVLIKVSGIYAISRIFLNVFGMTPALSQILMYLGLLSMVAGALIALGQPDFKRMLAYSSISQIGYIILGIGLGTPLGILGALFHLLNHATFKALLFLNSGSVEYATGTRELAKMGGLSKKMPVTATTCMIGAFSISGVPPFNGFWSKLLIIIALIQAGYYGFAIVAILSSVLTLWYLLLIHRRAFFGKLAEAWTKVKEVPFWMCLSTGFLAVICLIVGIAFSFVIKSFISPGSQTLAQGLNYAKTILGQ